MGRAKRNPRQPFEGGGKAACAVIREKLRIKPSIFGPPDELNGLTDAELEKRLLAATDCKSF